MFKTELKLNQKVDNTYNFIIITTLLNSCIVLTPDINLLKMHRLRSRLTSLTKHINARNLALCAAVGSTPFSFQYLTSTSATEYPYFPSFSELPSSPSIGFKSIFDKNPLEWRDLTKIYDQHKYRSNDICLVTKYTLIENKSLNVTGIARLKTPSFFNTPFDDNNKT